MRFTPRWRFEAVLVTSLAATGGAFGAGCSSSQPPSVSPSVDSGTAVQPSIDSGMAVQLGTDSGTDGGTSGDAGPGTSGPCDPLAPPPTALGSVLGVGQDNASILYVADQVPDGGGQNRVFVSNGTTLERQHVAGSGQSGGPPNANYTFSFEPPLADAGALRALLIQTQSGVVSGMALGPGDSRSFVIDVDAGYVPLTVLDSGAANGFAIQNLPNLVVHLADVSDGSIVAMTAPMDRPDSSSFHLFYGTASAMVEYAITAFNQDDYGQYVSFVMGGTPYNLFFNDPFTVDGGGPGPGSLYTGAGGANPALGPIPGALVVTERWPTPTSLSGLSFTCLGAATP